MSIDTSKPLCYNKGYKNNSTIECQLVGEHDKYVVVTPVGFGNGILITYDKNTGAFVSSTVPEFGSETTLENMDPPKVNVELTLEQAAYLYIITGQVCSSTKICSSTFKVFNELFDKQYPHDAIRSMKSLIVSYCSLEQGIKELTNAKS